MTIVSMDVVSLAIYDNKQRDILFGMMYRVYIVWGIGCRVSCALCSQIHLCEWGMLEFFLFGIKLALLGQVQGLGGGEFHTI